MDPTYILAKNLIGTRYEDLPQEVIEATKLQILDSLGVAFAGASAPGVQELFHLLKRFEGIKQCSVIASNSKLPVMDAAQINAAMTHALDFDDYLVKSSVKPACVVVPTCLAMAEYIGKLSGKECLTAIAIGVELMERMGLATKYEQGPHNAGWHFTTIYGVFGAAGIAGKLLGFDEDKMVNALGLAYHQAAGNLQATFDGALSKRMGPGFAAKDGIMAALMAEVGITGAKDCIEEKGVYIISTTVAVTTKKHCYKIWVRNLPGQEIWLLNHTHPVG